MKTTTVFLLALSATLAIAAPGSHAYDDKDKDATPTIPSYPTQSVGHKSWKRHIKRDAMPEPEAHAVPNRVEKYEPPAYATQSASKGPWKRHIEKGAEHHPIVFNEILEA
ncbi:MAG: hypothetical protein M1831_002659 [Alyxoria varia]|nr:MAG: hypothetical protein M1831_002659 [Alyxoria varia]